VVPDWRHHARIACSTIYDSGIELLGCSWRRVDNTVDGTGDFDSGLNRHGINISRKSSVPTVSAYNKVIGNTVRQCATNGIRILGGADNMVKDNDVSNCGTVATRAACIRVEGATGISTLRNEVRGNRCFDDQDANSWSTGQTVNTSRHFCHGTDRHHRQRQCPNPWCVGR
jgi:parallel beta-helix repeat protein